MTLLRSRPDEKEMAVVLNEFHMGLSHGAIKLMDMCLTIVSAHEGAHHFSTGALVAH